MTHLNVVFELPVSCSSLLHGLWKRQCFMAIKGRSHMCISCCTNIVQCRAWNKQKKVEAGRQGRQARLLPPSASHRPVYPTNTSLGASKSSNTKKRGRREEMPSFCSTVKEIWVSWGLRKKESKPFYGDFLSLPPASSSSSSLRWLLATYEPSEHPKPPATQHF